LIEKIRERFVWLAVLVSLSAAGYLAVNAGGKLRNATDVQFVFENSIPFVPNAIIIYLLIFPFLLAPVFIVKKYADFIEVLAIYAVLVVVSLATFFAFPTTMARPSIPAGGFIGRLFSVIWAVDGPHNLFPSLHVSSVVFAALVNGFFCPKAKLPSWLGAVLISVSTLFVKQHALVDVLGGAVFGASAYILLRLLRRKE